MRRGKEEWRFRMGVLSVVMSLLFTGCGGEADREPKTESGKIYTEPSAETPEVAESTEPTGKYQLDESGDTDSAGVRTLRLVSGRAVREEWDEINGADTLLAALRSPLVSLAEEERESYPGLCDALDDLTKERWENRLGVYEEVAAGARDGFADGFFAEDFTAGFAFEDVRVRRADEHVVSLLFEGTSYMPYYQNREFTYCSSATFDAETGERLSLADVVNDVTILPRLIEERFDETWENWESDVYTDIGECFEEGSELSDELVWTLDYDGITFYFNADVISGGPTVATIPFEKEPGLVREEYRRIPEYYGTELACNPDYIDLDWLSDYRDLGGNVSGFTDMRPTFVHAKAGDYLYLEFDNLDTDRTDSFIEIFSLGEDGVKRAETEMFSDGLYLGYGESYEDSATLWWSVLTDPEDTQEEAVQKKELQEDPDAVTVSNAAELIAAIAPDTHIILTPGDYNFSLLTKEEMRACSDYVLPKSLTYGEFAVANAPGLTLEAEESKTVRLITGEGYADVMILNDCDGAALKGLVLGHVIEKGTCDADVLQIDSSRNVTVEDCSLFGCGANGIFASRASGLAVTDTEIYECTSHIFNLSETTDAVFERCRFYDNDGMFSLWDNTEVLVRDTEVFNNWGSLLPTDYNLDPETTRVTFQRCTFRDNRDMGACADYPGAVFEDCSFPPASASTAAETPYDELLGQYREMMADPGSFSDASWPGAREILKFTDHMTDWYGYDILLDTMGYVIQDLNGDGVPELMIVPLPEYEVWIGALYTLVDGNPQLVFAYDDDGHYAYTGNGTFFYVGSKSTESGYGQSQGTYHIAGDGTALVCDSFCFYFGEDLTIYANTTGSWDVSESWASGTDIGDFNAWEGFEPEYETSPIPFCLY